MKKLFIFMIIISSICFISDVKADNYDIKPTDSYVFISNNQTQVQKTIIKQNINGLVWYRTDDNNSYNISKVAYLYDFSNYNYDYFSFLVMALTTDSNVSATFDSISCESVGSPGSSGDIYGFVCPNTKKQDFINIIARHNVGPLIAISSYISFYNDSNTAKIQTAIDMQTQQQQQQHEEIMNSNNSNNQNDFISFATNYLINDTTGTKSFLNIVPNFLNQLNNGTCTPLTLTIPFLSKNNELTIPCMVGFLSEHGFGNLITIYQFVLSFIVAYWLTVNWFKLFKETIDPFNYRIEVMDL